MIKSILTLLLCLIPLEVFSAEFLISNRESEKGDIILVKENEFKWSESELPKVVKLPNVTLTEWNKYVLDNSERNPKTYKMPTTYFDGTVLKADKKTNLSTKNSFTSTLTVRYK